MNLKLELFISHDVSLAEAHTIKVKSACLRNAAQALTPSTTQQLYSYSHSSSFRCLSQVLLPLSATLSPVPRCLAPTSRARSECPPRPPIWTHSSLLSTRSVRDHWYMCLVQITSLSRHRISQPSS